MRLQGQRRLLINSDKSIQTEKAVRLDGWQTTGYHMMVGLNKHLLARK